jgi:hypothetical protein
MLQRVLEGGNWRGNRSQRREGTQAEEVTTLEKTWMHVSSPMPHRDQSGGVRHSHYEDWLIALLCWQ